MVSDLPSFSLTLFCIFGPGMAESSLRSILLMILRRTPRMCTLGVLGAADYDVGAMKVDCVELGGFVGEASCVEITLYGVSTQVPISELNECSPL